MFFKRTYLCYQCLLLGSVFAAVIAQHFWETKQVTETKPKEKKIIWCTTNINETNKCISLSNSNERDLIKVGYDTIKIECKQAANKDECIAMLDEEKATMTTLDAGQVYIGGRYNSLVPIAQEVMEDGYNYYYAVAVVKRGTLHDLFSLRDLRGKKTCFAGVETYAGWMLPISTLIKHKIIEIIDCNNHVKSATHFFGPSCAVNSLSDKYNPIGDNSDKLCQLCIGPIPGRRCTDADPYAGYDGAFRCLLEAGDVAFLKHNTVGELLASREFSVVPPDSFELLCKDGSRKSVSQYENCNWGKVPSDAVVVSSAVPFEERELYQKFLREFALKYPKNGTRPALSPLDNNPLQYDNFGKRINQDGLRPNQDGLRPNQDGFRPNQDGFGPTQDGFRPNQGDFEQFENRSSTPKPEYDQYGNRINGQNEYDLYGNRVNNQQPEYDQYGNRIGDKPDQFDQYGNRINRFKRQDYGSNRFDPFKQGGASSSNRYVPDDPRHGPDTFQYYEYFDLFESTPRYGDHENLMFSDSARGIMPVPSDLQTYSSFLGDSHEVIMGVRECPVNRMTLCVTSDPEKEKCVKMRTALKAQLLKPEMDCFKGHSQINCMQAIRQGIADVAVLDASDVYTAGLNFDLVPFISEVYNLDGPNYYVVAVTKESDPDTELTYLRTKNTCHGGINTAAGWVHPLAFLISNGWIRPYGCNSIRAAAEYFTKSCVPGAISTEYNTGVPYDNMCDLCHGPSYRYCRRDASEDYYGHTGAFRCLVEGGGHVAFVKHTTVFENTGGKKRQWWARDNLVEDFELLCPDGTRAEANDYRKCNLGQVKSNAIVTRGGYGYNDTHINAYINLFMYAQTFYGRKTPDEFSFSMFTSSPPYSDLIFQDATTQLKVIEPQDRYYSGYLGPDFMRARRIVDCHAGSASFNIQVEVLVVSMLYVLTRF